MSDMALLLVGAGIALLSSVVTALVQHSLSLRADQMKMERDRLYQEQKRRREELIRGSGTLGDIVETLDARTELGLLLSEDRHSMLHPTLSQPRSKLSAEEIERRLAEEQLGVENLLAIVIRHAEELAILKAALDELTPIEEGQETDNQDDGPE